MVIEQWTMHQPPSYMQSSSLLSTSGHYHGNAWWDNQARSGRSHGRHMPCLILGHMGFDVEMEVSCCSWMRKTLLDVGRHFPSTGPLFSLVVGVLQPHLQKPWWSRDHPDNLVGPAEQSWWWKTTNSTEHEAAKASVESLTAVQSTLLDRSSGSIF